jgi:hypothetical protein
MSMTTTYPPPKLKKHILRELSEEETQMREVVKYLLEYSKKRKEEQHTR